MLNDKGAMNGNYSRLVVLVRKLTPDMEVLDVAEREKLGGYLAIGYLEQTSSIGKDDDICYIIHDKVGMNYTEINGTMDFGTLM